MGRIRRAAGLVAAAVVLVGVATGWRVSVRFVRADLVAGRVPPASTAPTPARSIPNTAPARPRVPAAALTRRIRPLAAAPPSQHRTAARAAVAVPSAKTTAVPSAPLPARKAGLHLVFHRAWPSYRYEVRQDGAQPPVKLWCPRCSAQGGVTLVEWNP